MATPAKSNCAWNIAFILPNTVVEMQFVSSWFPASFCSFMWPCNKLTTFPMCNSTFAQRHLGWIQQHCAPECRKCFLINNTTQHNTCRPLRHPLALSCSLYVHFDLRYRCGNSLCRWCRWSNHINWDIEMNVRITRTHELWSNSSKTVVLTSEIIIVEKQWNFRPWEI